jgi:hypothetical protein
MLVKQASFRKLVAAFAVVLAASSLAYAAALTPSDCSRITSDTDRLACFEKLFPPERPTANPKADLRDNSQEEKARLETSIKSSICKDCVKQSK